MINFETLFSTFSLKNLVNISSHSHFPQTYQSLAATSLLSVSMYWSVLVIRCESNRVICGLCHWLLSLTVVTLRLVRAVTGIILESFLWMDNIPFVSLNTRFIHPLGLPSLFSSVAPLLYIPTSSV